MKPEPIPAQFSLGVCYYPEHWPSDRWAVYARQMRELGLSFVRIGEFAWSRLEPEPGRFDWAWLDDAIETIAAERLEVVLCTPTATPPAWLVRAHPEMLPLDPNGEVRDFGARRHYDFASPVYRAECRRIVTELAQRYGEHPAVAGWQVDNEFGDHETGVSYGPASAVAFREWLATRYGTLGALNEAWGAVFWSQEYRDWAEIDPPNLTVTEPNPSHVLDYRRFASDMVAEFLELQVEILREHAPGRWITHNYMRLCPEFDHFRNARSLDFVSLDVYPTGAVAFSPLSERDQLRWSRTGHPDLIAFNHDLHRGLKHGQAHWVMEGQAGHINWAPSNPLPADGAVALWTAQAYAHGASCVSSFRWRAATAAQEIMHSGLLRHDETFDRGAEELRGLALLGLDNDSITNDVVLLHDYDCLWIQTAQQHSAGADYWEQMMLFYTALRSLGVDVDVRHPDDDFSRYRVIVAPALQIVGADRARRFARCAEQSQLVFGPRAAFRTPSGRVHEDGQPGPLRDVVGWRLLNFDGLAPGMLQHVDGHDVTTWAESYRLAGGTALAMYDDGPLAGQAAVVHHGNAVTIGAWSPTLVRTHLRRVLSAAGIACADMPEGVRRSRRGPYEIWLNFNEEAISVDAGNSVAGVSFRMTPRIPDKSG